jgi:hypothetical protein
MDFDPQIVGFASQPFWLFWRDEASGRGRSHAPDFFARQRSGRGWWWTAVRRTVSMLGPRWRSPRRLGIAPQQLAPGLTICPALDEEAADYRLAERARAISL